MSNSGAAVSSTGQFDDALEPLDKAPDFDPREGKHFIDEDILEWSEESGEDDGQDDEESEEELWDEDRVDDEDWEVAEGDFTKQYNRLKQHVAVRTGNAVRTASATNQSSTVAPLPAVNRPRISKQQTQGDEKAGPTRDKAVDQLAALSKYSSRIANISVPYARLGVGVNRKGPSEKANLKDKSDRATTEQVLDPRTRIILFKMIGRGLIDEVNGCVSTGKEANVYHALSPQSKHLALKIYKTSILIFKDRDRYVTGEHRFRRGYGRKNPRKMVRLWAEKEMRNLKRLSAFGVLCPEPIEVRENVLVMGFLGDREGWASPRLKDAEIPAEQYTPLYHEILVAIRRMYQLCKLVHADLSEYNILYHDSHLYIIDVSQSVEHDHPSAFDFLRSDLKNIEEYFGRFGVQGLGVRRCFDYVTTESIQEGEEQQGLLQWLERAKVEVEEQTANDPIPVEEHKAAKAHEEEVFIKSYIPRTLNEVYDPERDVEKLQRGDGDDLIYRGVIGLKIDSAKGKETQEQTESKDIDEPASKSVRFDGQAASADENDEEEDEDDDSDGKDETGFKERRPRGHRHEDREAKKERKKAVKEEARERRKTKMPKAEKKKRLKAGKS